MLLSIRGADTLPGWLPAQVHVKRCNRHIYSQGLCSPARTSLPTAPPHTHPCVYILPTHIRARVCTPARACARLRMHIRGRKCLHALHTLAHACTRWHIPAHACTCLRMHTHARACSHEPVHACTCLHTLAHACARIYAPANAGTRLHTPAQACARLHALAHACTRLHTLVHACTHLHALAHACTC